MPTPNEKWIKKAADDMAESWQEIFDRTSKDKSQTQRGGHENEDLWIAFLKHWLPPQYEVLKRKYIVGEIDTGTEPFETDIVVLHPGYPHGLRDKTDVLASGVAAAFSTKSTTRADSLEEAAEECAQLQRTLAVPQGSYLGEMQKPFIYGFLSHSHDWKKPGSTPEENVTNALIKHDEAYAQKPSESLDIVCVADVGTWVKGTFFDSPMTTAQVSTNPPWDFDPTVDRGPDVVHTIHFLSPNSQTPAIAVFLSQIYGHLALRDPDVERLSRGFQALGYRMQGQGTQRIWKADDVLSSDAHSDAINRMLNRPAGANPLDGIF